MLRKLIKNLEHQVPGANCVKYEMDINKEIVEGFHVPMSVQACLTFHLGHPVADQTLQRMHPTHGRISRYTVRPSLLDRKIGEKNPLTLEVEIDLTDTNLGELND